jgi:hypothetical protein
MKRVALVLVGIVVAVAIVVGGRVERARAIHGQQDGILGVRQAIGGRVLHPLQAIYDPGRYIQCLTYPEARQLFGLELCFDGDGRAVEAVDRRHGEKIWSILWARSDAPLTVPTSQIDLAVSRVAPAVRLNGLLP